MSCTRKLKHWKKPSVPNMSHGPMGFRSSRKTTSSLRSLCPHSQRSTGCVRSRSQQSEGTRCYSPIDANLLRSAGSRSVRLGHSVYQFAEAATKLSIKDNFDVRALTHSRIKLVSQ